MFADGDTEGIPDKQRRERMGGECMVDDQSVSASNTSDLPPHVIRNIKLEGIFLPYTRKPRDELYGKFKRFVHYTSADNALKIIKTKRLWIPLRA